MPDTLKWLSENKDVIQALSSLLAILIGFLSIVLTFWTLWTNRKHHRLSVRPLADIDASDYEDRLAVTLTNRGSGPMVIKTFHAIRGKETKPNLIDWMPPLPKGIFWSNFYKNLEDAPLRPSDSILLIEFTLDLRDARQCEARDAIRRALAAIAVGVDYVDIYNAKMHFGPQSLSWFQRNLPAAE